MPDVLLPYAMRRGSLVHISCEDIPSGLTADCTCPECDETLIARKGERNQYHFAHKGEAERPIDGRCFGGFETAAHIRAKEIIAAAGEIRFPDNRTIKLESVALERTLDPTSLRPDITVTTSGGQMAVIEIFITHRCPPSKAALLFRRRIPSMEIVLQAWRHAIADDAAFQEAVLYGASRVWIYDPTEKDRRDARMVFEDARREAAARADFLAGLPAAHAERLRGFSQESLSAPPVLQGMIWDQADAGSASPPPAKLSDIKMMSHEEREAWIESVMAPVRRRYTEIIQPQILAAADARRTRQTDAG